MEKTNKTIIMYRYIERDNIYRTHSEYLELDYVNNDFFIDEVEVILPDGIVVEKDADGSLDFFYKQYRCERHWNQTKNCWELLTGELGSAPKLLKIKKDKRK